MAEEGTFTTREEVLRKAGSFASATSSAEAYTNQFIKEAEGFICCRLRENWVLNYATLNDNVKELLRLITSNIAAIKVIQYDLTNFAVRSDAETQINVLWGVAVEALEVLFDFKTKTYGEK